MDEPRIFYSNVEHLWQRLANLDHRLNHVAHHAHLQEAQQEAGREHWSEVSDIKQDAAAIRKPGSAAQK